MQANKKSERSGIISPGQDMTGLVPSFPCCKKSVFISVHPLATFTTFHVVVNPKKQTKTKPNQTKNVMQISYLLKPEILNLKPHHTD
jgi:hypothetical protein